MLKRCEQEFKVYGWLRTFIHRGGCLLPCYGYLPDPAIAARIRRVTTIARIMWEIFICFLPVLTFSWSIIASVCPSLSIPKPSSEPMRLPVALLSSHSPARASTSANASIMVSTGDPPKGILFLLNHFITEK